MQQYDIEPIEGVFSSAVCLQPLPIVLWRHALYMRTGEDVVESPANVARVNMETKGIASTFMEAQHTARFLFQSNDGKKYPINNSLFAVAFNNTGCSVVPADLQLANTLRMQIKQCQTGPFKPNKELFKQYTDDYAVLTASPNMNPQVSYYVIGKITI